MSSKIDQLQSPSESPSLLRKTVKAGVGAVLIGSLTAVTLGGVWGAVGVAGGAYLGWTHGKK